ncbi:hypothetical protein [Streptomyces sp. TLI_171]|uniref:hypothetical protein n=1 Tax=Streptomyces sp. TLI_171 TaxID=1938859 RepID=UPI000C18C7B1|nr:hypothetical protein [Streptomyces sp. TLI_171]RKE17175.1 hypothetical protein BX266_0428 [Streptomyces sp. TLI_171]
MTDSPNVPDPGFRLGPVRKPAKPDSPSAPEATVQLRPAAPAADEQTVRLRPAAQAPDTEETFRLAPPAGAEETVRLPAPAAGEETVRLDPAQTLPIGVAATVVAPVPVPVPPAPVPQDEVRRYGPGVPPRAAAVWRGEAATEAPEPVRRRWDRWLLVPLVLMLALLGYLLWDRYGRSVEVAGVSVAPVSAPGCDGTAVITGVLETDGGEGDLTYRWVRSDGTDSGGITQHVQAGHRTTEVHLDWTFQGHGELAATARLEVLKPAGRVAVAQFPYSCP